MMSLCRNISRGNSSSSPASEDIPLKALPMISTSMLSLKMPWLIPFLVSSLPLHDQDSHTFLQPLQYTAVVLFKIRSYQGLMVEA
jgi:hypothetical protein